REQSGPQARAAHDELPRQVHQSVEALGIDADEFALDRLAGPVGPGLALAAAFALATEIAAAVAGDRAVDAVDRGVRASGEEPRDLALEAPDGDLDEAVLGLLEVLADQGVDVDQERSQAGGRRAIGRGRGREALDDVLHAMKRVTRRRE